MKHRKLIGLLAFVLAIVLTMGVFLSAGAANLVSDVDGDGKITAFDAQMIAESNAGRRQLSDQQLASIKGISVQNILKYIFGDSIIDVGDTDGDGVQEIYTVDGLQQLHTQPDGNYILMQDLDLEGADWTPVANFSGSFNGNGKTISNFTITTSVADTRNSAVRNVGFFGDTAWKVPITDLHLRNVTLTAPQDAEFTGFFVGTLRGELTGCTVTGTLNDTREEYPTEVYTGIMAGRMANGSGCSIIGGTSISISDEIGKYTTDNLCANVKLNIANYDINGSTGKVALAGYKPSGDTVSGQFVDTTYSSDLRSETIQARQDKVVDYMNAMATVQWTPSEDLTYTANNGTNQTYKAGTVYSGLPYNGHNGSLERFLSVMGSQDENGVYTAMSGLGADCGWQAASSTKYYIRMYTQTDSQGAAIGYLQKTANTPNEVITFNTTHSTLSYVGNDQTFYLGATENNENILVTGSTVSQLPVHLYTISNGRATLVKNPAANTPYKLGVKTADGSILFFNGEMSFLNTSSLITTAELDDAMDVYLESVSGGYHMYYMESGAWSDTGFYLTMGNDCSGAINWAWMQITNVITEDVSEHSIPYKGGAYVLTTQYMVPTETNRVKKGIYPVGSWETVTTNEEGKLVSAEFDPSKAAYQCTNESYTGEVLINNGIDTILEAYAQTRKADGLVCYVSKWSSNVDIGGHARLVAADPVVIRNADGTIDSNASYMLLTEQGVGFTETSTSRWHVEKKHTFFELTGNAVEGSVTTATKTYLPITIRALQDDYMRNVYLVEVTSSTDPSKNFPILSPAEGRLYSYHHINSVTVTVTSGVGKVLYQHEAFTGIGASYNTYRGRNNDLRMEDLHAEAFYEAAKANNFREGKRYSFSVDVLLSTGETIRLVDNRAFTYTAPTE